MAKMRTKNILLMLGKLLDVKKFISIVTITLFVLLFNSCFSNNNTKGNVEISATANDSTEANKRLSFNNIAEIVADSSYSTWAKVTDSTVSLVLHFQGKKDTLLVEYSPECWLYYPYKLEDNKIVVYWDNTVDTKYQFDIVKAINKLNDKYIGEAFMNLELVNDTTLKATYPIEKLITVLNNSSNNKRRFFPNQYTIVQQGYVDVVY